MPDTEPEINEIPTSSDEQSFETDLETQINEGGEEKKCCSVYYSRTVPNERWANRYIRIAFQNKWHLLSNAKIGNGYALSFIYPRCCDKPSNFPTVQTPFIEWELRVQKVDNQLEVRNLSSNNLLLWESKYYDNGVDADSDDFVRFYHFSHDPYDPDPSDARNIVKLDKCPTRIALRVKSPSGAIEVKYELKKRIVCRGADFKRIKEGKWESVSTFHSKSGSELEAPIEYELTC